MEQVLTYIAARLETDRVYTSAIYANADKVFGDKKGAAKLRCAFFLLLVPVHYFPLVSPARGLGRWYRFTWRSACVLKRLVFPFRRTHVMLRYWMKHTVMIPRGVPSLTWGGSICDFLGFISNVLREL